MKIKGYKLKHSSDNFKAFESESHVSYCLKDFLRLCEIQLKNGYAYLSTYENEIIFKKLSQKRGSGK